jgi:tautomerase-like protein
VGTSPEDDLPAPSLAAHDVILPKRPASITGLAPRAGSSRGGDRFQVITQHSAATLQFDRHYLDIERTDQFVMMDWSFGRGEASYVVIPREDWR